MLFDEEWVGQAVAREPSASDRARAAGRDRRRRRRARVGQGIRRFAVIGIGIAVAVGAVAWYLRAEPAQTREDALSTRSGSSFDRPSLRPAGSERILDQVPVVPSAGGFAFIETWPSSDRPVTYDPCRVIDVVLNPDLAPPDYVDIVGRVLTTASAASGLSFVVESIDVDEPPTMPRAAFNPSRYGDRWSPVLIAWSTPDVLPELHDRIAGVGGSTWIESDLRGGWNVSGAVILDAPQLAGDPAATAAVLLHEVGHLLGLAHTSDPEQLMHATGNRTTLNDGDRAGFASIGAGDCAPPL